ncbi:MAG TPA: hypothetical protein VNT79_12310 [Phycisphaerae bacterium]|nr:hypothetical protein [Phycisphaerae bacterium]
MAVELDDDLIDEIAEDEAGYREAIREGTASAIKCAMGWVPPAAVVLLFGFYLSKSTFLASEHILEDAGVEWQEALWPSALYGLYGLAIGALIGWRINITSGLVGNPAWTIGVSAVLAICVIGILGSIVIFGGAIPKLVWVSAGVILVAAGGAVTFFAKWNA